jgi:hypothetical protein
MQQTINEDWIGKVVEAIPRKCSAQQSNSTGLIQDQDGMLVGATLGDGDMPLRRACLIAELPYIMDAVAHAIESRRTDGLADAMEVVRARYEACRTL